MSIRVALSRGIPVELVTDMANGASGAQGSEFCIPPIPAAVPTVVFTAQGTFTVLDGNIQATQDDGTTWRNFLAFDFVAQPVLAVELQPGVGYRFNFTTVTSSTTVDVKGSLR